MRYALLAAACLTSPALAQENSDTAPLQLSATTRIRLETIEGQARAGFNGSDSLLNLRTILAARFDAAPVTLVAEVWDSRVYGANRRTPISTNEVNTVELVQAYAEVALWPVAGTGSTASLQAGRFLLNLGSRRLVAADDYRNTTNGYTGLHAELATKSGWRATAIYTLPQRRFPDDLDTLLDNGVKGDVADLDLVLWGGLVSRRKALGAAMAEVSFFHLGERDTPRSPSRDRSLDTLSVRLIREPARGAIDYEVEAIGQRGRAAASTAATALSQNVRAWFLHADAGYTFAHPWLPRLSLEYDHASGDGRGGGFSRFDPLLGMRRADLAPSGLYNAIARTNLVSPGVRLEAVPDTRTDVFIGYRPMWLASRSDAFSSTGVRDPAGRSGNFAGHQAEGRVRYQLSRRIRLEVDGVLLAKGRFLRTAPNAPPGRWTRYLSLNFTAGF